jgi:hypothetical protein
MNARYANPDLDYNRGKANHDYNDERFIVHKHTTVAACEVAKRPKHHFIVSILYLINFWLRKINRRTELLKDVIQ